MVIREFKRKNIAGNYRQTNPNGCQSNYPTITLTPRAFCIGRMLLPVGRIQDPSCKLQSSDDLDTGIPPPLWGYQLNCRKSTKSLRCWKLSLLTILILKPRPTSGTPGMWSNFDIFHSQYYRNTSSPNFIDFHRPIKGYWNYSSLPPPLSLICIPPTRDGTVNSVYRKLGNPHTIPRTIRVLSCPSKVT